MRVVLCTVAKHENSYINEWCRYHLDIGFSHIYIYDNNEVDYPNIKEVIDSDILSKITIIDYHKPYEQYLNLMLHHTYKSFYEQYNKTFDWCCFLDVDEFITGISNVKTFLSNERFKNVEQIKILWKVFGDNNIISRDITKPVHEFFKQSNPVTKVKNDKNIYSIWFTCCKLFVIGHRNDIIIENAHYITKKDNKPVISCYPSGRKCIDFNSCNIDKNYDYYKFESVFVNHYITKTISEYLENKYNRNVTLTLKPLLTDLDYFWAFNDKTEEKEEYIKKFFKSKGLIC